MCLDLYMTNQNSKDTKHKLTNRFCDIKVDVWCPGTIAGQRR